MKKEIRPELLAECLEKLESGQATLEECLATYPDVAEDLRGLLEMAHSVRTAPPVVPDPVFRSRARAEILSTISAEKNPVTSSSLRGFFQRVMDGWTRPPQLVMGRASMPALIIALIFALTTATGGGIVLASEGALPGDALYGVKQAVEGLPLTLANGDEAKAQVYLEQAAKRVAEVREASERGRPEAAAAAADGFSERVAQANRHLERAEASGKDVDGLVVQLEANLERQKAALEAAMARVPEEAQDALAHAMEMAERGLNRTMDSVQGAEMGRPENMGRPAETGRPEEPGKPEETPRASGSPEGAGVPGGVAAAHVERATALVEAARAGNAERVRVLADKLAAEVEAEVAAQERVEAARRYQTAGQLRSDLEGLQTRLQEVAAQLPDEAQPAMTRVMDATAQGLAKAQQMMEEAPAGKVAPAGDTPVTPSGSATAPGPQVSPPAPAGGVPGEVEPMIPELPELPIDLPAGAGRR